MRANFALTGGIAPPVIDEVFSAYPYIGNGAGKSIKNGISLNNSNEAIFTTAGTHEWIVPEGVTSVCVALAGGGGGSGGSSYTLGLIGGSGGGAGSTYKNNIAVTPGTVIRIDVGAGGTKGASGVDPASTAGSVGGQSGFNNLAIIANGGNGGAPGKDSPVSGGTGGVAANGDVNYTGNAGVTNPVGSSALGGLVGLATTAYLPTDSGRGGQSNYSGTNTDGVTGSVRIIWGAGRSFPSTNTDSASSGTNTHGGLVWLKCRNNGLQHVLSDTVRGINNTIASGDTAAAVIAAGTHVTAFNKTGFSLSGGSSSSNTNASTYASWTFKKAAKFFDCGTYTGNASARTIAHSLGVTPGMIMVKRTNAVGAWIVWHRSNSSTSHYQVLNTTAAAATSSGVWNATTPTGTEFSLGTDALVNASGGTYMWYAFAHDANANGVIQCGNYTGNGATIGPSVSLGWEPQYVLIKTQAGGTGHWMIFDVARGIHVGGTDKVLLANTADTEAFASSDYLNLTPTGFDLQGTSANTNANGVTYMYMAIRRSNTVPTSGTKVFNAIARTGTGVAANITGLGFAPDLLIGTRRSDKATSSHMDVIDTVRGPTKRVSTNLVDVEDNITAQVTSFDMDGYSVGVDAAATSGVWNTSGSLITWAFKRATGFFDIATWTSSLTSNQQIPHSLGVAPELIITQGRNNGNGSAVFRLSAPTKYLRINSASLESSAGGVCVTASASAFGHYGNYFNAANTETMVAYLFATLAGVSKVGSYTGNGSSQTVGCGFTTGARFILIKRLDATGNWFIWDTVRGIVSGNDPWLCAHSAIAEVTTDDSIDPDTTGFIVNQVAATNINVTAATYFYLAIA